MGPNRNQFIALICALHLGEAFSALAIDFNNLTGMVNEPRIWGVEVGVKF